MTTSMLDICNSSSTEIANTAFKLFEDKGFKMRVIMRMGDPWVVAKDVAACIEHSNVTKMCELCRDKDKVVIGMDEIATNDLLVANMTRELTCISESGLYRILAKCNLPKCEPFENWVFDEVLPSIRKTGKYEAKPLTIYDYARALLAEKERSDALEAQNKALELERDEAVRTKTQYQSNLAAQMSGRVGGLTTALNRVKLENSRLKGDRLTKEDVYIIMNTQGVSFTLKTVKDVIRDTLNVISEYLDEPFPKIKIGEHTNGDGKVVDVQAYVYTRKTVRAFFEYVENNPLGWQARNRKFILGEWLNHHMTIPADQNA